MNGRERHVYKVFDKLNIDKFYIGSTFDIKKRWYEHKRDSNSVKLNKDMKEYGTQDFDIKILFSGTEDEAYAKEIEFIKELKPYYNNALDLGGRFGAGNDNIGEHNPNSKISENIVIHICKLVVEQGKSVKEVSNIYTEISESQIYDIVCGRAWEHVVEAPRREILQSRKIGEESSVAKLSKTDIIDICNSSIINNESVEKIMERYPKIKSSSTIYDIINGKTRLEVKEALRKEAIKSFKGNENPNSSLVEKDVINICIRVVVNNEQITDISKDYPQVGIPQLYKIVRGDAWEHIKEAPRRKAKSIFSKEDILFIREEAKGGKTPEEIRNEFCPNKKIMAVKRVIYGKSFQSYPGPINGIDY